MEKSYEGIKTQTLDLNLNDFQYNSVSSSSDSSGSVNSRIKELIANDENFRSESKSSLSSNSSSVLEFLIPENLTNLAELDTFASSSPIFTKKPVNFQEFHSEYNKNQKTGIRTEGEGKDIDGQNYSSAQDIKFDLEAFDVSDDSLDFEGNLNLNEAVVIDNEENKSSSSGNGEILKDLIEESESQEKFETDEFYGRLGESLHEIVHQVVSLLPEDLIEEISQKVSDLNIKGKRNISEQEEKNEALEDDTEKNMIKNSLTDERREKQKYDDPKGQCSCNKCFIL